MKVRVKVWNSLWNSGNNNENDVVEESWTYGEEDVRKVRVKMSRALIVSEKQWTLFWNWEWKWKCKWVGYRKVRKSLWKKNENYFENEGGNDITVGM